MMTVHLCEGAYISLPEESDIYISNFQGGETCPLVMFLGDRAEVFG